MKIIKTIITSVFFLAISNAYADGGSGSNAQYKCRAVLSCPSGQSGSIALYMEMQKWHWTKCKPATVKTQEYLNAEWSDSDIVYRLKKDYAWGVTTVTRSCVNSAPTYTETKYDYGTQACPPTQPNGIINTKQSYDVWSDGSIRNISGFVETSRTCAPTYVRTDFDYATDSCPAAQPGGIINTKQSYDVWSDGSIRNISGFVETSRTCAPTYVRTDYDYATDSCSAAQPIGIINTKQSYDVWSDGSIRNISGFVETSRTCAPTYVRTDYDYATESCPAAQPSGIINTKQSYDVWSDGSIRNVLGFVETSRTCAPIKLQSENQYRESSCSAGQSGEITQSRTYDVWTDGSVKAFSKWVVIKNSCSINNEELNKDKRTELCSEGYTGKKTYKWEPYYTDDSYSIVDVDGSKIDYILSVLHQREILESNTCKEIPTQGIETKDGVEQVSCDDFLVAVAGSYTGAVYKYGEYVTSYSSKTKASSTVFNTKSIDQTSCEAQMTDMSIEYKTGDCGLDETGSKNYYRYKATNSKSEITYPYGDWAVLDNTCTAQGAADTVAPVAPEKVTGLLGNMHFTSSRLMVDDSFSTYLNNLTADGWAGKERHKLTISIDDLSSGSYDAKKISSIISKFQSVVGAGNADVKIVLPRSIDKLVGNGNITAKASASKSLVLKSIRLVGTNAVVNYVELTSGKAVKAPIAKETKIQVLSSGVNLAKISSE